MRLLWLCNNAPGVIRAHQNHTPVEAVNWVDQVLEGLRRQGLCLHVLFRGTPGAGALDDGCTYLGFDEPLPQKYYGAVPACAVPGNARGGCAGRRLHLLRL